MSVRRPIKAAVKVALSRWKLGIPPGHRAIAYNAQISGQVTIGDYTYVGGRSEIRAVLSAISIGRYCSIGRDVKIFSAGQAHRFDGLSTYPFYLLDDQVDRTDFNVVGADTIIGNDVWIGSNATISPGVVIGDGAVIGASAVVTRDVPAFSMVAGVPARPIGARFDAETAAVVAASRWWDLEYAELRERFGDRVVRNRPLSGPDAWRP